MQSISKKLKATLTYRPEQVNILMLTLPLVWKILVPNKHIHRCRVYINIPKSLFFYSFSLKKGRRSSQRSQVTSLPVYLTNCCWGQIKTNVSSPLSRYQLSYQLPWQYLSLTPSTTTLVTLDYDRWRLGRDS